jgi:hypothetical protein
MTARACFCLSPISSQLPSRGITGHREHAEPRSGDRRSAIIKTGLPPLPGLFGRIGPAFSPRLSPWATFLRPPWRAPELGAGAERSSAVSVHFRSTQRRASPCAGLGRGGSRTARTTLRFRGQPDPRRQPSPSGRGSGTGTLACL